MKKLLTKNEYSIAQDYPRKQSLYYYEDGKRIEGVPKGISGDLTGISGNLDECEITECVHVLQCLNIASPFLGSF